MSRVLPFSLFLLIGLILIGHSIVAHPAGCPDCLFDNPAPMTGPASDDGRRTISVQIDSTWGSPTNAGVWNATCAGTNTPGCPTGTSAISMWNTTTDASGNHTGYFLDLQQSNSNPQIIIKLGDPGDGNCASMVAAGPPFVITLPANIVNFSADEIRGRIAHEIGHVLGLGNDPNCSSIMSTSGDDCHRTSKYSSTC